MRSRKFPELSSEIFLGDSVYPRVYLFNELVKGKGLTKDYAISTLMASSVRYFISITLEFNST